MCQQKNKFRSLNRGPLNYDYSWKRKKKTPVIIIIIQFGTQLFLER